jgi:hypothetical protein
LSDFETTCRVALAALDDCGLGGALVGGFAVSVRTEPRFTRDVDLAVAVAVNAKVGSLRLGRGGRRDR